jgi:hypothetical protein
MDRRTPLKWVLAASTAGPLLRPGGVGAFSASKLGYGSDPDLSLNYHAGELWPLTLTPAQRRLAATLSDLIIPADDRSPSASAAGVVDFIDEWVSAPYPDCLRDRGIVLGGFMWLDLADEHSRRHLRRGRRRASTAGRRSILRPLSRSHGRRFLCIAGRPHRPWLHRQPTAGELRRTAARAARVAGAWRRHRYDCGRLRADGMA